MSDLIDYWPPLDQVYECLRTEAETTDEALLLAVHEPVELLRRPAQRDARPTPATEDDLLSALLRPAADGSAVLVAITGASGVGKSHMVRWLKAQLERHPRKDEFVIVSIPKTASLRKVVELILAPLPKEQYEALRHDLGRAAESLDPQLAANMLAVAIAHALLPYAKGIEEGIRAHALSHDQGPRIAVAQHLHTLFRDPVVADLWLRRALLRIVGSSIGGSTDPAERQFRASDLEPPEVAATAELTNAVQRALAFLASANGRHRATAAEILQELLDPALRTIFRFTEALHQRTIDEIVDDIRRRLLKDGKELILLVEDLAALAGIQEPLLNIMIAESDSAGVRIRAPIRSAIAVTDGFLAGRNTILTRAREEWVVPSEVPDEDSVVRRLVSLTGRYLNAARWGLPALRHAFQQAGHRGTDLYAWVPRFEDSHEASDSSALGAFGYSEGHYSLFPFNPHAVRSLGAAALRAGGRWTYNPRAFINEVLRKTLAERPRFEAGRFPPAGFHSPRLDAQVNQQLEFLDLRADDAERLKTAVCHWAGAPSSLRTASVPKAVFDAFGLLWPFEVEPGPGPGPGPTPPPPPPPPPLPPLPPASDYNRAVEAWTANSRMTGQYPHRTRVLLTTALNKRMDFDGLGLRKQEVRPAWFWLPPTTTTSNPSTGTVVLVAPTQGDIPARVKVGLQALDRWDQNQRSWAYPDGELDHASASALLDDLEAQIASALTDEVERDAAILAEALHRQNLVAGLAMSASPLQANLKDLLAPLSADESPIPENLRSTVRQSLDARRKALGGRAEFQLRLRDFTCYFQGATGNRVLGVDSERLRRIWKRPTEDRWSLGLTGHGLVRDEAVDALDRLSPANIASLAQGLASAIATYQPKFVAAFDEDYSRVPWREDLQSTVRQAVQLLWPTTVPVAAVQRAIEQLAAEGADVVIRRVRKVRPPEPDQNPNASLAILGAVDLPRLVNLAAELDVLEGFLGALERLIDDQTSVDDRQALAQRDALIESLAWEAA
ncbi:MAG: protein DpdH [Burkholderiaceae bacterium]|nr:protein DpdH [Burkholderiaceae bacterium]